MRRACSSGVVRIGDAARSPRDPIVKRLLCDSYPSFDLDTRYPASLNQFVCLGPAETSELRHLRNAEKKRLDRGRSTSHFHADFEPKKRPMSSGGFNAAPLL